MNRDYVLALCYSARTIAEVEAAKEARSAYLLEHPNDEEILEMGEMLSTLEDALEIIGDKHEDVMASAFENTGKRAH